MDLSIINVPVAIITFILGFLVSHFTLPKSERKKLEQEYFKNSNDLRERDATFHVEYVEALRAYTTCEGEPSYEQFYDIAIKGDRYFGHLNVIADSILSNKVDRQIRDSTFVPGICNAADKSLPRHYEVLQKIAVKKGFSYSGELERKNFRSVYDVVERFRKRDPLATE